MPGYIFDHEEAKRVAAAVYANEGRPPHQLPPRPRPVRTGGGSGGTDGADGATTTSPCGCDFVSEGSVDCLGTGDSPTTYVVDDLGPLGTNVELTFDASCEWISEDIDYDCSGS